MTDPILLNALRQLVAAQKSASQDGEKFRPEDMDAFLREETKGKYGLNDIAGLNLRNFARSGVQGLTFNFGDEILGKLPKFMGGGADAEEEMRLREKLFHSQHPVADDLTQVAGMLPYALIPGAGEASLGGVALRGAATGAVAGGLAGAGAGETDSERLTGGAVGAAGGALLGGMIPAAAGVGRSMRDATTRAGQRVMRAVQQDGGVNALRAKLASAVAAGRGDEVMLGDLGPHLRAQMDFAANNSDDVLVPLAERVKARQSGASDRLLQDVRGQVGDPQAEQLSEALDQGKARWAAGPNGYGGLRDANANFNMAELATRLNKPTVKQAWEQAQLAGDILADSPLDELMKKVAGSNPGLNPEEVQHAAGFLAPSGTSDKVSRSVTFDDVQQLKRALDGKVTAAYRSGNGTLAQSYKTVRSEVVGAMEDALPQSRGVNQEYARRSALEDALQAGVESFHASDTRGLKSAVAQLSKDPQQLTLFRKGMASELIATLRSTKTNRSVGTELIDRSPAMEDKLKTVFGTQAGFDAFMENAQLEAELAKMRGPISGSQTARRLQTAGFDPAELGIAVATHGMSGLTGSLKHMLVDEGRRALQGKTAAATGKLLMTQGAPALDQLLKQLLAKQSTPLLGRAASTTLPALAPRATGSLLDLLQQ